ncbi:MAG: glutathione S-transferase [Pseudomonadota bacterium]
MITLHHLENSRSQRILWLLEELGVDYEIKRYERDPVTSLAPQALKDIHPLGKSPVITDGDIVVAESGAIIEYLMDTYSDGRLRPGDDPQAKRDYTYFMHYAEGTVMPLLIIALLIRRIEGAKMPFFAKPIARGITGKIRSGYLDGNMGSNLKFMESTLATRPWFTGGTMTAADIQMSFVVEGLNVGNDLAGNFPKLADFLSRCQATDGYKRALERGGPYQLGG